MKTTEETLDMPVKAIAPWFGGKRTMAPRIIETLGSHRAYWEPFCGSLAILLVKPVVGMETVNDLHGDLINLARVLQCESLALELYRTLSATLMHEALFREAHERLQQPFDDQIAWVDRAVDYMVVSWQGRNGVSGTSACNTTFSARFTKNGGHAAKRWQIAVESIPAWHQRLRNVTILKRDAFELLEKIEDADGTAIYCDPPYLVKGAKYLHDFQGEHHQRLADLLQRFRKTRVVVSYYDDPRLQELYPGWRRETVEVTKALVNQGMRDRAGPTKATEVLLVNERGSRLF